MNVERASGLVLRTRLLTETSLIVHWITREWGRLATVAKGARRPKSPFRGRLDLFFRADFTFARSRRSDLHVLREVRVTETHPLLRADYQKLLRASYGARLIEQVTETETPIPEFVDLLDSLLVLLNRDPAGAGTMLAFELRLLRASGLHPDWTQTRISPAALRWACRWLETPLRGADRDERPGPAEIAELSRFLDAFIRFHLGRIPAGRQAALNTNGVVPSNPLPCDSGPVRE